MTSLNKRYLSVNITRFFMKIVGFWISKTKSDQLLMDIALVYSLISFTIAAGIECTDLYFSFGDFYEVTSNVCTTMLIFMIFVKFVTFITYREGVMNIISHAETHFWSVEYDEFGDNVLNDCDKKGILLTYSLTFMTHTAALSYIFVPVFENQGKNETDRVLPFRLWVNWPVTTTPYYEILYTIEALATIHAGICTYCFDNFLCCINLNVSAQLKILAHKIEIIGDKYLENVGKKVDTIQATATASNEFSNCVRDHLILLNYVANIEHTFTWILLGQILLSCMAICFGGFQTLATELSLRKFIFFIHCFGGIGQLFIYTWSCNCIISESEEISNAAYNMEWYILSNDKNSKIIKNGIILMMIRTLHPCVLTAGKFAPVNLQTFTSILSTAASYFTILRQMSEG